jgi:hypothetical protein
LLARRDDAHRRDQLVARRALQHEAARAGFLATETTKLGDPVGFGAMMAVLAALGIAAATEPSAVVAADFVEELTLGNG